MKKDCIVNFSGKFGDYEYWGNYNPQAIGSNEDDCYACVQASNGTLYRANVDSNTAVALHKGIVVERAIPVVIDLAVKQIQKRA